MNAPGRYEQIRTIGLWMIALNIALALVKFYFGWQFRSVALEADAFHTFSDALTTALVLVGAYIARKPADREHPFGHGRAEFLSGFALAVILGMVALEILVRSAARMLQPTSPGVSVGVALVIVATGLVKQGMAWVSRRYGQRLEAPGLTSDAYHHLTDALTSYGVALGLLLQPRFPWIDGFLGLGVSGFILFLAFRLIRDIGSSLLGTGPTASLESLIRQEARKIPGLRNPHNIRVHGYGNYYEITLHVEVEPSMPLSEAHALATRLERAIAKKIEGKVTVHVEPAFPSRADDEGA